MQLKGALSEIQYLLHPLINGIMFICLWFFRQIPKNYFLNPFVTFLVIHLTFVFLSKESTPFSSEHSKRPRKCNIGIVDKRKHAVFT